MTSLVSPFFKLKAASPSSLRNCVLSNHSPSGFRCARCKSTSLAISSNLAPCLILARISPAHFRAFCASRAGFCPSSCGRRCSRARDQPLLKAGSAPPFFFIWVCLLCTRHSPPQNVRGLVGQSLDLLVRDDRVVNQRLDAVGQLAPDT